MIAEKKILDDEAMEAQTVFEIPDRALAQVVLPTTNLLSSSPVVVPLLGFTSVGQICTVGLSTDQLTCAITQ